MLLAQISDPHVIAPSGDGKLAGVDTAEALACALSTIRDLCGAVDAVMVTGDLTNWGKPQ